MSIYSYYNNKFNSIGSEETEEQFNNRLLEIKEYIRRRLPFIKVVHSIIFDIQAQSKYPNH